MTSISEDRGGLGSRAYGEGASCEPALTPAAARGAGQQRGQARGDPGAGDPPRSSSKQQSSDRPRSRAAGTLRNFTGPGSGSPRGSELREITETSRSLLLLLPLGQRIPGGGRGRQPLCGAVLGSAPLTGLSAAAAGTARPGPVLRAAGGLRGAPPGAAPPGGGPVRSPPPGRNTRTPPRSAGGPRLGTCCGGAPPPAGRERGRSGAGRLPQPQPRRLPLPLPQPQPVPVPGRPRRGEARRGARCDGAAGGRGRPRCQVL